MRYEFFSDRTPANALPEQWRKEMDRYGLLSPDGLRRVSYCGLISSGDSLGIFLPRSVELESRDSGELLKIASDLVQAIEIYSRETKTAEYHTEDGERRFDSIRLSLVRELLRGYQRNGLYSRRAELRTLGRGKPRWSLTLSRTPAFPSSDGAPVYLDYVGTIRRHVSLCEVARIHAHVISELDVWFSWLLTGSSRRIAPELKELNRYMASSHHMLAVLRRELRQVYSDADIHLIKNLISYIEAFAGNKETKIVSGVSRFHHAWEYMLHNTLDFLCPVNKLLPVPAYSGVDGELVFASGKKGRTDSAIKHPEENTLVVIDAKYYGADSIASMPGWGDIVKQLFYEKTLSQTERFDSIDSVFVFPGDKPVFEAVHLIDSDGVKLDNDFRPIRCAYLRPETLLRRFVARQKLSEFTRSLFPAC